MDRLNSHIEKSARFLDRGIQGVYTFLLLKIKQCGRVLFRAANAERIVCLCSMEEKSMC